MSENDKQQYYDKQKSFENANKKMNIYGGNSFNSSSTTFYDTETLTENTLKNGRFPANTILTYDETDFEEVCGGFPNTKSQKRDSRYNKQTEYTNTYTPVKSDYRDDNTYRDSGSAARYFYCAKASKKDREEGLEYFEEKPRFQQGNYSQSPVCSVCGKTFNGTNDHSSCGENTMTYMSKEDNQVRKNIHPTVKPTELMQYLVRLVTPQGGVILDPFMGSGSTGKAIMYENKERNANYKFIGIEQNEEYCRIAKARIEYVINLKEENKIDKSQITIDEFMEV